MKILYGQWNPPAASQGASYSDGYKLGMVFF